MDEMRELYQATILDHNRSPRNFCELPNGNRTAHGNNPLCGDKLTLYLRLEDDVVKDVGFEGSGCAIATASASMLTQTLKGKTRSEANALFERFHALLTTGAGSADGLGKLEVFGGVREFPVRVKCATLAWHTLMAALAHRADEVTTE